MRNKIHRLTFSALVMSLYIVFMYLTQSISFGQYQVRLATGLYGLAYHFSFLCLPLGLATFLSNILFWGDIINGVFGFAAGFITCKLICLIKRITKNKFFVVLPIAAIPSLVIPLWLSVSLHISYRILFFSLLIGQTITAYTCGIVVVEAGNKLPRYEM